MGIVENVWEMSYPVWEMARRFSATPLLHDTSSDLLPTSRPATGPRCRGGGAESLANCANKCPILDTANPESLVPQGFCFNAPLNNFLFARARLNWPTVG